MSVTRRKFMQALTVAGGAGAAGSSANLLAEPRPGKQPGRKKRTLYFNDARHYYLYVFEPPMTMEDAWVPIDEVAGTAVDTFVYGVERGDGLFYPSRVGQRFGADMRPFELTAYWRTWENMQSLIDRGLDPLTVLIDRAHQKGMDFFASVRMASYGGLEGKYKVPEGGRGLAHEFVRDHQYAVLKELATEYATDGVELDFAAAPGGMPRYLRPEEVPAMTPVLTEWVAKISKAVRNRSGKPGQVGARVYPTEEMCLEQGLDVRTWIREGLVDYLAPILYIDFTLDVDMPIDWVIEAAHAKDIAVYGTLQPLPQGRSHRFGGGSPQEDLSRSPARAGGGRQLLEARRRRPLCLVHAVAVGRHPTAHSDRAGGPGADQGSRQALRASRAFRGGGEDGLPGQFAP